MKKHGTVTITKEMLQKLNACEPAMRVVRRARLLPARISTDPEANIELALQLIAPHNTTCYHSERASHYVHWLACNALAGRAIVRDCCDAEDTRDVLKQIFDEYDGARSDLDVNLVSQQLAMIADGLLCKQGR